MSLLSVKKAFYPAPVLQATIGLESYHHVINGHFVRKLIYLGLPVSHLSMRTFATAALYALI